MTAYGRRTRAGRRGLAIVPGLVCLVLVTMLCGVLLKQSLSRREVVRTEERRMQAEWLAESGLARASSRLDARRDYRGETWEIPPDALGGGGGGVIRIRVRPDQKAADRRRVVSVEADYPAVGTRRARLSKQVIVDLGPETPGGPP